MNQINSDIIFRKIINYFIKYLKAVKILQLNIVKYVVFESINVTNIVIFFKG